MGTKAERLLQPLRCSASCDASYAQLWLQYSWRCCQRHAASCPQAGSDAAIGHALPCARFAAAHVDAFGAWHVEPRMSYPCGTGCGAHAVEPLCAALADGEQEMPAALGCALMTALWLRHPIAHQSAD